MESALAPGLLIRISDWHAHSLEVSSLLENAGQDELARQVKEAAALTLLRLIHGAPGRQADAGPAEKGQHVPEARPHVV